MPLVSIEWSRRKEWMVGAGSGVGLIDSLVKTWKWSDGEQWVWESDGAKEESVVKKVRIVSIDEIRQGSRMKGMKNGTDVEGADSEIWSDWI